jgi:hypothetical protein
VGTGGDSMILLEEMAMPRRKVTREFQESANPALTAGMVWRAAGDFLTCGAARKLRNFVTGRRKRVRRRSVCRLFAILAARRGSTRMWFKIIGRNFL